MKKAIISILLILPFLLIVVISIAGMIYGDYDFIEVTDVYFADEAGNRIDSNTAYTINLNTETQIYYVVLPENASNKNVRFETQDTSIVTINENGIMIGRALGTADVTISTYNLISTLHVTVVDSQVREVTLNRESITGYVGGTAQLVATVLPVTASNRNVVWSSSNSAICSVDNYGQLTFNSVGSAVITVRAVDGGLSDTCIVTVTDDPIVSFTRDILEVNEPSIDLFDYITGEISELDKISFEIRSGKCSINTDGHTLTFSEQDSAEIRVYYDGNLDVYDSIRIYYII